MTKCTICGEKVPLRSLDHNNKARHPSYRRALWRFIALVVSEGIFYWGFTILFVQNAYNNYSFTLDVVYLVIIVSPIFLALHVFMWLRLTRLRRSLRADLDAERRKDLNEPSDWRDITLARRFGSNGPEKVKSED